ncbi:hypothetical protein J31TS4_13520 [Paenibacillus sp. J31TS4]|nr:hypothetical protein J31TS4_13520 [Paenibacillus sp. J31TS4]
MLKEQLAPASIEVFEAEADSSTPDAAPYFWGGSGTGYGELKIRRILGEKLLAGVDYELKKLGDIAEDRNYFMRANLYWKGITYKYSAGTVTLTYTPSETPDLGSIVLTPPGCVEVGKPVTFGFTFTNSGKEFSTPFNVRVLADGTQLQNKGYNGANAGQKVTGSFPYNFTEPATVRFTIELDTAGAVEEKQRDNNTASFSITASTSCSGGGGGGPEQVAADFKIEKPRINYGESNWFQPSISVTGGNSCTIATVTWRVTQNGQTYKVVNEQASAVSFAGPPYPAGITNGPVSVTMELKTTCGTTKTVGPKTFEIVKPASCKEGNQPPVFKAGWVYSGNTSAVNPLETAVIGNRLGLQIIEDNQSTPPTPYDPDGDGYYFRWDWQNVTSPWLKKLRDLYSPWEYDTRFTFGNGAVVTEAERGTHTIDVYGMDLCGNSRKLTVSLFVTDPNPVPIITLPPKVVEGRTFTPEISGAYSFSPIKDRRIVSYEWYGTKQSVYPTAGSYEIKLDVIDDVGLKSLAPATARLNVLPDLPPIAQLVNPGTGVRNITMNFRDTSYSPDDDPIAVHTVTLAYDSNNNGSFADEAAATIKLDGSGTFTYRPTKVGKYRIHIHLQEGLGYKRTADKDFFFEVVNEEPNVSFTMQGEVQPPPLGLPIVIGTDALLNEWKRNSLDGEVTDQRWYKTAAGTLKSIKFFNQPTLRDFKSPFNGLDLSKPTTLRDANASERIKRGSGALPFIKLENRSMHDPLEISKTVDGIEQWRVLEDSSTAFWVDKLTGAFLSPDLSQFAYVSSAFQGTQNQTFLRIRNASNGNLIRSIWLADVQPSGQVAGGTIYGTYGDTILVATSGELRAYDWNGNRRWAAWGVPTGPRVISKDGYLYAMNPGGNQPAGGGYAAIIDLMQVDLRNGGIVATKRLFYESNEEYIDAYSRDINLLEDGRLYLEYTYSSESTYYYYKVLDGPLTNRPMKEPYFTYGQFYHPGKSVQNAEFQYAFQFDSETTPGEQAGFSFRMVNNQNFYRVEHDKDKTSLVAYVNGARTVLGSKSYPISAGMFYSAKVKVTGSKIKVYVNGVPLIDVTDSRITGAGYYGPYATKGNTEFKGLSILEYPGVQYLDNVVVVGQPIRYNTSYSDPEGDPGLPQTIKWTFRNEQPYKYLNSGDGYSDTPPANSYSNRIVTSPIPTLDRVGYYKVDFQQADDPSPAPYKYADGTFAGYSKFSDPYTQYAKVVRKPVAQFTIKRNADQSLQSDDQSYNPDRWLSPSNYQAGYGTNRGILDRRWKYTAPDGTTAFGFPSRPNQKGTYLVSLAVMQEDGVWSDWAEQSVEVSVTLSNRPPAAQLTFPSGSRTTPTPVDTLLPTIRWNQTDPDPGTLFAGYQVLVKDEAGTVVVDTGVQGQGTTAVSQQWAMTQALVRGNSYQVQVRVSDGLLWSDWSNVGWMRTNSPPLARMIDPGGTRENPTLMPTTTPRLTWSQTDPDAGTVFRGFQLQIADEQNRVLLDSGRQDQNTTSSAGSWTASSPLPPGEKLRVRVRVSDGLDWSDWSEDTWMRINRPPVAVMTVPDGSETRPTVFASRRPVLEWKQSDPDPGTVFTYFQLQITRASDGRMVLDSGEHWQQTTDAKGQWAVPTDLPAGEKLKVRVRVYDGLSWSDWSAPVWMLINRPPTADFDWSPQPVWEGDTVRVVSRAEDPDGDPLTYSWQIVTAQGTESGGTASSFSRRWTVPGEVKVTLTVSDGWASASVTKSIPIRELTIEADVSHTPEWYANHLARGHQVTFAPKDFYSGERWLVAAAGPPTVPIDRATASFRAVLADGGLVDLVEELRQEWADSRFTGSLYDARLGTVEEALPEGLYDVAFELVYANGTVKRTTVPLRILGPIDRYWSVHRVR